MSYTILPYQNVKIETFLELDYSDSLNNVTLQPFSNSREIKHTPVVRLTKRKYVTTKINPIVMPSQVVRPIDVYYADAYSSWQRGITKMNYFASSSLSKQISKKYHQTSNFIYKCKLKAIHSASFYIIIDL